jgi:4-hydroxythreonine-4-phosphate dehydrogenase
MTNKKNIKVGITIGDINGIGPEVTLKALKDARILSSFTPIIYGSQKAISHYIQKPGLEDLEIFTTQSIEKIKPHKINVIDALEADVEIEEGQESIDAGKVAIAALEMAAKDISTGLIDVIVTAPISKSVCQKVGFNFPGHTEYFSSLSNGAEALMVLCSSTMKIALVTTHISLKEVPASITKAKIISKAKIFDQSLKKDFGLRKPKIAVLSLNPHSGEDGKMGGEEKEIIIPAINELRESGVLAFGPFPSDGFFGSKSRGNYDGVLSMYHDQGLTVFKALSFDEGVNYSAGIPIVRTSPDHGTAYDIAGQGVASETSMRNAIYMAVDIYASRMVHKELINNPLVEKKQQETYKEDRKNKGLKKN